MDCATQPNLDKRTFPFSVSGDDDYTVAATSNDFEALHFDAAKSTDEEPAGVK
jgi:hypothetical protein